MGRLHLHGVAFLAGAVSARDGVEETLRAVLDPEEIERLKALGYVSPKN